jgi:hypothetical protein
MSRPATKGNGMKPKAAEKEEKLTKTTLRIPTSLWTSTRIRALEEGTSVQDLMIRAIQNYLKGGR